MNNLNTNQSPFSFLAKQPKKPASNGCNLAWIDNSFHLHGNNYFIYSCHTCQEKQIKKGKNPKPTLIEEASMNKPYNHCQKCGRPLGFWSWFKFWEKDKLCPTCEEAQL